MRLHIAFEVLPGSRQIILRQLEVITIEQRRESVLVHVPDMPPFVRCVGPVVLGHDVPETIAQRVIHRILLQRITNRRQAHPLRKSHRIAPGALEPTYHLNYITSKRSVRNAREFVELNVESEMARGHPHFALLTSPEYSQYYQNRSIGQPVETGATKTRR